MKLFMSNKRVLRSFKFLYYVVKLSNFLRNTDSTLFVLHVTKNPIERMFFHQLLNEKQLNGKVLPNGVSRFFFKETKYVGLKNLLLGNVMIIKSVDTQTFKKDTLKFILQQDYFSCSLLIWNRQVYTHKDIKILNTNNLFSDLYASVYTMKHIKGR